MVFQSRMEWKSYETYTATDECYGHPRQNTSAVSDSGSPQKKLPPTNIFIKDYYPAFISIFTLFIGQISIRLYHFRCHSSECLRFWTILLETNVWQFIYSSYRLIVYCLTPHRHKSWATTQTWVISHQHTYLI